MSKIRSFLGEVVRLVAPLAIVGVGVGGLLLLWSMKAAPAISNPEVKPPLVATRLVEEHRQGLNIATDGLVVPARDVTVATQVAGKVTYKSPLCQAGKYVAEGMVLFKIDAQDYRLEVDRLTKERAQADANLQEVDLELQNTRSLIALAEEEVELQQRELQRQLQLRGAAVSQSAIDQARRAELGARNALQSLENQKRLLETRRNTTQIARELVEVRLEKAQLDLERTEVRAPVAGVIVEEMVEQDSFVPVGAALAKIEDTQTTEVRCSLKMEELYWLWRQPKPPEETPYRPTGFSLGVDPGGNDGAELESLPAAGRTAYQIPRADATIIYEIGGRRFAWAGVLDRFEGIGIDERTRTVPCRVVVSDPRAVKRLDANGGADVGPRALVRGMFVRVVIDAQPDASLVRIPEEAIRPGGKVWVARDLVPLAAADGDADAATEAGMRQFSALMFEEPVELASVQDGGAVIDASVAHLRPGEHVVVTPLALESGQQWLLTHGGLPITVQTRDEGREP